MPPSLLWFRRDLRLHDSPALAAAAAGGAVIPVFVLDGVLRDRAGAPRLAFLYRTLRVLEEQTYGRLLILAGSPAEVLGRAAQASGATAVHISADTGPYGRRRDASVQHALASRGVDLIRTGSPYAVTAGRVRGPSGAGYQVFSPFYRAWQRHGWRPPADSAPAVEAMTDGGLDSVGIPDDPPLDGVRLPPAGEPAALAAWRAFRAEGLSAYAGRRNLTEPGATSGLSAYLKYGCIHPRTLLADADADADAHAEDAAGRAGVESYRAELAWREFYADVLWHTPQAAGTSLRPALDALTAANGLHDEAHHEVHEAWSAWSRGRTGFPLVDAAMRHLGAEAWMPNRVRMVVASFLVKDLHLPWQWGARHFLRHLVDGDLASNNLSWQWVAGTGTDAAPYFRVFNPVRQGQQFDPAGDYVRRWVPELRHVAGIAVHEPWTRPDGLSNGYPDRIIDHGEERAEALRRYAAVRPR